MAASVCHTACNCANGLTGGSSESLTSLIKKKTALSEISRIVYKSTPAVNLIYSGDP